ncbi:phage tail protein, partial [Acinetobacter sp. ME22]|uniref:phage tail protein n=1 Tax=Acinetobacter sp. ME22 TaxID=2904802 RepID=UPI001EDA888B
EVVTESHYRSLDFERRTLADCINQVSVTYYDSGREKDSTLTVQDLGRIAQQGGVSAQDIDYKGVSNNDLASALALRDLKTLSTELASIEFETTEAVAGLWNKGHPFKFSNTRYGLDAAVFRVTEIQFGDGVDNTVTVKAVEDAFSNPMTAVVEYTPITRVDHSAKDATGMVFE